MIDISVAGDKELQKALDELMSDATASKMINTSAIDAMEGVKQAAEANAPRDTGRLASNMYIAGMRKSKSKGWLGARLLLPPRRVLGIKQNAKGYYPTAQEYGTKPTRKRRGSLPAKRFFRDALYRGASGHINRFAAALRKQLEAFAAKQKRKAERAAKRAAKMAAKGTA